MLWDADLDTLPELNEDEKNLADEGKKIWAIRAYWFRVRDHHVQIYEAKAKVEEYMTQKEVG
jgi:hypothetical protein